ncbi:transposase [Vallitalea maricola]
MARQRRERSKSGIYHIMLRGIDKRNIFLDDEDREKFLYTLLKAKQSGGFSLYAYCLMDNHVHLLIKENEEIGNSIKRITVSYVQWHNNKYGRSGHLFENRYKSEVVESENYLLKVARYIHQNPVKANIIKSPSVYIWSSYNKYIDKYYGDNVQLDTDNILNYFNNIEKFEEYMIKPNTDECLEYYNKTKLTDNELKDQLEVKYDIKDINNISKSNRDKMIFQIRKETGASIRQLSRVLGLGRGIIENATKIG